MNAQEFIRRLPKAELHLHLEGAIPWELVCEYADGSLAETPAWWANDFRYTNFRHFGVAMSLGIRNVLTSVELYQAAARAVFEKLVAQNVRYVEISFGANLILRKGLDMDETVLAIREALPPELNGAVFGAFNREQVYAMDSELAQAVFAAPLDGIDLHGAETLGSAQPYVEIFERARRRGLMTKAHAGELVGAPSVWDACQYLKVRRIEHGTRAAEDEQLVQYLIDEQITLDMCPTSNVKLNVIDQLTNHPIRSFFEKGVRVTVNTDDPTYFGCTLTDELTMLVDTLGFSLQDIAEIEKNAFRVGKLDDEQQAAIFAEIDALVNELE